MKHLPIIVFAVAMFGWLYALHTLHTNVLGKVTTLF